MLETLTHEQRAIADAAAVNQLNVIHHVYVDITGDLVAGALLGQILYWFGADRNGRARARIRKDGYLWIAKGRADWWDEIRISAKQYDRAAKILKEKKFIEIRTMKFNGNPTSHIRIIPEQLNKAIDSWKYAQVASTRHESSDELAAVGYSPLGNNSVYNQGISMLPKSEPQYNRMGNVDVPEKAISLTEITAENTNENTAENTNTIGESVSFDDVWNEYPKKIGKAKARRAFEKAVAEGENALSIMVECALYRQYIEQQCIDGLERRYIPTGGNWFDNQGWLDQIPSISSYMDDFDAGVEYNRKVIKLRRFAREGDYRAAKCLLLELPY